MLRQFGMGTAEAGAAESAFIEDAHQIDHHILAAKALAQLRFLIHIAVLEVEPRQHQQMLVLFAVSRQNRDLMTVLDQTRDQPGAQETGAAENHDG